MPTRAERGSLVVAPRQGLFGRALDVEEMLELFGDSFEIDTSRVFLVGHSMGAGQVAKQVELDPPPVSPARGPPNDWGELGQVHDDRAIFQASDRPTARDRYSQLARGLQLRRRRRG